MHSLRRSLVRIACSLALVLLAAPRPVAASEPAQVTRTRWLMGTLFTASAPLAPGADSAHVGAALDAALDTVAALERRLSNWSVYSEVYRLNDGGSMRTPSEPLRAVIDSALVWAAATGGAYDPTIEPLTRAYDLRGAGRVPDAQVLAAARARVGHARIVRRGDAIDLGGALIDLGGIGKGFALDRAAAVLAASGVRDAVLDAGGQRLGRTPARTWLADPRDRDRAAVRVQLPAGSFATSTQRERTLVVRGRRVGHVLDPRTGQPVPGEASVSVAAASGTRADALSTALLVMGRTRAQAFAAAHPELGVLWLEPGKRGLDAYAWNLTIDSVASHVRVVTGNTSTALSR